VAKSANKAGKKSIVIENKKARHDYFIEDTLTCGLVLSGTEVKSLRTGKAGLRDSFARIERGEAWVYNFHISPYQHGNRFNHDPLRKRKLLLKKSELLKIYNKTKEKKLALIPLKVYFSGQWAKLELALARGKKMYDKREAIKKKELQRQIKSLGL